MWLRAVDRLTQCPGSHAKRRLARAVVTPMILGPRVHIREPDAVAWRRAYPTGFGASAFCSPDFQRVMLEMYATRPGGSRWMHRAVSVEGSDLWLPVIGCRDRFGRWELKGLPIGYDLMPVQRARMTQAELDAWVAALSTPRITHFIWHMPSWHTEEVHIEPRKNFSERVEVGRYETYVIRLDGTAEQHLDRHVSSTMRRYIRRNEKAGVTVVANPDAEQLDAYFRIYEQSYYQNGWVGEKFPRSFFDAVSSDLGDGGELAVVLHEDRVVGGGVILVDRAAVHYFQGAIDRSVKDINPHVELYWYAMRRAEALGLGHLNLGGVNRGNEGLVRFKTSWGATATHPPKLTFRSGSQLAWHDLREMFAGRPP